MTITETVAALDDLRRLLSDDPRVHWAPRLNDNTYPDVGRHVELWIAARTKEDAFSLLDAVTPVARRLGLGAHCEPTLTADPVGWTCRVEAWATSEGGM